MLSTSPYYLQIAEFEWKIRGVDGSTYRPEKPTDGYINMHRHGSFTEKVEPNKEVSMHYYRVKIADVIKQAS